MSLPRPTKLLVRLPKAEIAASRCRYVLDWLCRHPYLTNTLSWEPVREGVFHLDLERLTDTSSWLASRDKQPQLDLVSFEVGSKTVYGFGPKKGSIFYEGGNWGFDWVSALFFWLSRWEEQHPFRENPTPLPAIEHWFVRHKLERLPQADRLALALFESLGIETSFGESRVHLSHDLDHVRLFQQPWMSLRYGISLIKMGGPVRQLTKPISDHLKVVFGSFKDPFDNAAQTLMPNGGTLYLLLGRHVPQDGGKDKTDARLQEWIQRAKECGYDLGIHPSYTTADHAARFKAEVQRFKQLTDLVPSLSRQHFLRWDWKNTPAALLANGVRADSTLGYRERLGFRCGTSFPYYLYDFTNERASALIEWPLVAMESAWMLANDQDPERCAEDWQSFVKENERGADLMINIHNSGYYHAQLKQIDLSAWNHWIRDRPVAAWASHFSRLGNSTSS